MTATTQTQTVEQEVSTQYERAVERASRHNITVQAQGHRKSDSARIWCTNSYSGPAARWHVVVLEPRTHRLACDCASRVYCAHKASVHMALIVEASKQADTAARLEAAAQAERAHSSVHTVRLMDNSRPVSIFK